ncbi:MAG: DUF3419 family protein [Oscillospiraceae bacterium]|nr:DUF3419 family protein [Oscillospiraceae bacterium]
MSKADFSFIRYSNCWEDTEILLKALDIQKGEVGISVASAGDNTLAMLTKDPSMIYAFDVNKTQLYCCELKIACFKYLCYKETLTLLGVCGGKRLMLYKRVRCALSEQARRFFDKNINLIEQGIIHAGKFEHYFDIFRNYMIPLFSTREEFLQFAHIDNLHNQYEFYKKHIDNRRFNAIFRIYFGYKIMGRLGRDSSFYDYVSDKEKSGSDIRKRFEFGIKNTVNAFNPYINYIVSGRYTPCSLPLYLRRENYDIIRKRIDRIKLVNADMLSLCVGKVDFANLSDIFEYMNEAEFAENTRKLTNLMNPNGRVAYWNMQNQRYPDTNELYCDHELSESLFRQNNSWFYRDFLLYRRKDAT